MVVALLLSAAYHARLPITRRVVAHMLDAFVSGEIKGSMETGRIDVLTADRVVARHVVMRDPYGTRVVVADTVELVPDVSAALEGRLVFRHAKLRGAHVRLVASEEFVSTFIEMYAPERPSTTPGPGLSALVDDIDASGITIYGDFLGLESLRAENVRARGRINTEDDGKLRVSIWDASGDLVRPFAFVGHIDRLVGTVHTDPRIGIRLHAQAHHRDERAQVNVGYALPENAKEDGKAHLDLLVHGDPIRAETLEQLGYDFAGLLVGQVRGHFRLFGPTDDLRMRAWLATDGGPIAVDGRLPVGENGASLDVSLWTPGVDLERVVRDAPAVHVGGRARLVVAPEVEGRPTEAELALEPFLWNRWAVPALTLRGALEDESFRIDHVEAPYAGGELEGEGRIGYDATVDLHVRGRIPQIARDPNIRRTVPGARGSLSGDVHVLVGGSMGERIAIRGDVSMGNLRYGPLEAARMRARGSVEGTPRTPAVDLRITGRGVSLGGYPLGEANMRVRGGPRAYDATGRFLAAGDRRVEFEAHVDAERGRYVLDAPRIELAVGELVWRGAAEDVAWRPDQDIVVGGIRLASGSQRLETSGTWRFRGPEEIEAQLQDLDLTALRAIFGDRMPDIEGRSDTHIRIEGDIERPNLLVEGALRDGTVYGVPGVNAVYVVNYDDGQLAVDAQADLGARGRLALSGTGALDPSIRDPIEALEGGVYEMELGADELDVALVRQLLGNPGPEMRGHIIGRVIASGPIQAPSFTADLAMPAFQMEGWPELRVLSSAQYENGVLVGRVTTNDRRGELAEAEGSLLIDLVNLMQNPEEAIASLETSPWRVSFRLPPRTVAQLPPPVRDRLPPAVAPLRVALSATFQGGAFETRGDLHANLDWEGDVRSLNCGRDASPRAVVDARLREGVTTATALGFLGDAAVLRVDASAPTPVDRWLEDVEHFNPPPVQLAARLMRSELSNMPLVCASMSGPMSATLEVAGLLTDTPRAHLRAHSEGVSIRQSAPVRVDVDARAEEGRLTGGARLGWEGQQRATVRADVPIAWGGLQIVPALGEEGRLRIRGSFEDAPVEPLLTWIPGVVDVSGLLSGTVAVEGTIEDPVWSGDAQLENGYLEIVGIGQQLTDVRGHLRLEDRTVIIDELVARDVAGRLRITGRVGMEGLRPATASLDLRATGFPVRREGAVLATLTGGADVRAVIGTDGTDARVRLRQLNVRLPEEPARSVQALERHPDVVVLGEASDEEVDPDPYELRLSLDATDQPFWVRRSDFSAQVIAQLDAIYRDPEFRVRGFIELRRGFFEVFGKRFDVDRGTMNFDGRPEINPEVNLVATHELRRPAGETVSVVVTGRLATPTVEFRSSIPECQDRGEAIALLVSGRCQMDRNAGTDREAGAEAASFLAGLTAGVLTLTARRELGEVLPVISIESSEGGLGARVRAGFQADSIIPQFLRGVVQGAYVEGFFTAEASEQDGTRTDTGGAQGRRNGVLLELQFPHDIVGTGTVAPAESSWSVDVTWEP